MFIIQTESAFDAAHFLKDYQGKCRNIHGHRWKIIVSIASDHLESEGENRSMVRDFSDVKNTLKQAVDEFDHSLIIEEGSLKEATLRALLDEDFRICQVPFRPTAEEFARFFYEVLSRRSFPVYEVQVYETPGNCATYRKELS